MDNDFYFSPQDQYLTFFVSDDAFAVCIKDMTQVIKYVKPSKLPQTSPIVAGIIPFRGDVIPVIDLRGNGNFIPNEYTIILVLNIEEKKVGIIVDSIYKIIKADEEEIKEDKMFLKNKENFKYVKGIVMLDSIPFIVLDLSDMKDIDEFSYFLDTATKIRELTYGKKWFKYFIGRR